MAFAYRYMLIPSSSYPTGLPIEDPAGVPLALRIQDMVLDTGTVASVTEPAYNSGGTGFEHGSNGNVLFGKYDLLFVYANGRVYQYDSASPEKISVPDGAEAVGWYQIEGGIGTGSGATILPFSLATGAFFTVRGYQIEESTSQGDATFDLPGKIGQTQKVSWTVGHENHATRVCYGSEATAFSTLDILWGGPVSTSVVPEPHHTPGGQHGPSGPQSPVGDPGQGGLYVRVPAPGDTLVTVSQGVSVFALALYKDETTTDYCITIPDEPEIIAGPWPPVVVGPGPVEKGDPAAIAEVLGRVLRQAGDLAAPVARTAQKVMRSAE